VGSQAEGHHDYETLYKVGGGGRVESAIQVSIRLYPESTGEAATHLSGEKEKTKTAKLQGRRRTRRSQKKQRGRIKEGTQRPCILYCRYTISGNLRRKRDSSMERGGQKSPAKEEKAAVGGGSAKNGKALGRKTLPASVQIDSLKGCWDFERGQVGKETRGPGGGGVNEAVRVLLTRESWSRGEISRC